MLIFRKAPRMFSIVETVLDDLAFAVYSEVPSPEHSHSWTRGVTLTADLPQPVIFERNRDDRLLDLLLTNANQLLVSERATALVLSSSSCARAYPAEIRQAGELISDAYFAINFECAFSCLDMKRSRFDTLRPSNRILSIRKVVLLASRLPHGEDIFRLNEYPSTLLCTAAFKQRVEALGLSGFGFHKVAVR